MDGAEGEAGVEERDDENQQRNGKSDQCIAVLLFQILEFVFQVTGAALQIFPFPGAKAVRLLGGPAGAAAGLALVAGLFLGTAASWGSR